MAVPAGALPRRALGTFEVQHNKEAHGVLHPEGTAAICCHLKWRSKETLLTGILCLAENFETNTVSLGLFS